MATENQDFDLYQGSDVVVPFQILQSDGVTPQDITGATFTWALAYSADHATAEVTKTSAAGIAITNAANGELEVTLAQADTASLPAPRSYFHELVMTLAGNVATASVGTVSLKASQIN